MRHRVVLRNWDIHIIGYLPGLQLDCCWIRCKTGVGGKMTVILGTGTALPTSIMERTVGDVPIGTDINDRTMCAGIRCRWINLTDDRWQ